MNDNDLMSDLREIRFLHGIDAAHLAAIANIAQIREFRPRDVVFREGDSADAVYLVMSGRLSLELSPATAYRKQLVTVGPHPDRETGEKDLFDRIATRLGRNEDRNTSRIKNWA